MILPTNNPTKSFWIEGAKSDLRDHRTTPDLPATTDVVIIGSGYTGASAAYWLHKMSPKGETPSMVMLESRDLCGGATGRNGGLLRPHAYSRYTLWSKRFGPKIAHDLIAFEFSHIAAFEEFMKEEGLAEETCYQMGETWDAAMTDEAWVRLKKAYDDMAMDHGKEDSIVSQCRVIEDAAEAEDITQMKGAIGAIVHPSGQIWAYKFVHALLRMIMATGHLNVQAHTPCLGVTPVDAEGWIVVKTERGDIKTKKVIHATNRWAGQLLPENYQKLIFTGRGTLAALKAPEGALKHSGGQQWDHIVNLPPPYNHIILGGAKPHTVHNPRDYLGNDDEETQMKGVPEYYHSWAKDHFTGMKGDKSTEFALPDDEGGVWTGLYSISIDGFPWIGPVPGMEGQFISAGYSGHGMPRIMGSTAYLAPHVLASLGIQPVTSSIAEKFTTLPEPYRVTAERVESLKDADPEASIEADVEDNLNSAKKLWSKKPESLTMMEKMLNALNLGSGIKA